MIARVFVTLKPGVLDPQGQAVQRSLVRLGFGEVKDARIGKYIELKLDCPPDAPDLRARIEKMCKELLANTVIEDFRFDLDTRSVDGK